MTPKQRLNILLADVGPQLAQAAVEWLQNISLPAKSKMCFPYADCSALLVKAPRKE
jgi:hypothetical protein